MNLNDFSIWRFGANFIPGTAVNQLEMRQKENFDEATIFRELGWAADVGMSVMRVFLHDLAFQQDEAGVLRRMEWNHFVLPFRTVKHKWLEEIGERQRIVRKIVADHKLQTTKAFLFLCSRYLTMHQTWRLRNIGWWKESIHTQQGTN